MTPPPPIPMDELLAQAGWIRALARRLARDAESADDLAQGTLTAALERPPAADKPLRPWLARVVANLARKDRRGAARRRAIEEERARAEAVPAGDRLLAELEEQQRLARLVAGLSEPYRTVLLRRYYRGESAAAIARATGVPAATVRSQLARGLERLRAELERRCDGDPRRMLGALALASGGPGASVSSGGLLAGALTKTIEVIAMNTGTKVAAATVTAALVCVGALGLYELGGTGEPARPAGARAAVLPEPAPLEDAGVEASPGPAGARSVVDAPAPDASSTELEQPAAPEPAPERTAVTLRAVDEDGEPIAGAWAEVTTEEGLARDFPPSAESAADGRVELELPKGAAWQYVLDELANAYVAVHAPGRATDFFVATVRPKGTRDQGDVVLAPGGGVSGRVLDTGGEPLADVVVMGTTAHTGGDLDSARLGGPEVEGGRPTVRTDDGGRFELFGLHLGEARVFAHADGFLWSVSEPVLVRAGAAAGGVSLTLEPVPAEARITGIVVDPTGAGVEGAEVLFRAPEVWDAEGARTGPGGRFRIDVTVRGSHRLLAQDPEGRFGPAAARDVSPGASDLVLALTPRRTLAVRVVDSAGEPIEGAWVTGFVKEDDHFGIDFEHTDAEGRAEVLARAEAFHVNVGEDDFASQRLGPFDPAGLPAELLVELEALALIRGRVLDGEEPVADARVDLAEDHGTDWREMYKGFPMRFFGGNERARTDDEGRFTLPMRAEFRGTYVLLARKEGYALTELALPGVAPTRSAGDIEVQLSAGGAVEGRVLVSPKRSPEGIVVAASRGDGHPAVTRTDADGRYRFEHLTPGPWRVEDRDAEPEGRILGMAPPEEAPFGWNCEVFEGKTAVLDLDLRWKEDLRIGGRLTFDGAGAAGWSAALEAPTHADRPYDLLPGALDEDGRFSIEAEPGTATLMLRSPLDASPTLTIESKVVIDAERRPVEIALATGTLAGRMPEESRLRIYHRIDERTRLFLTFETDAEGAFRVEGVPAGEIGLQRHEVGNHGLGWYGVDDYEVVAGETTTID